LYYPLKNLQGGMAWSGAAHHVAGLDHWIGWTDSQRRNRLHFMVSNTELTGTTSYYIKPNDPPISPFLIYHTLQGVIDKYDVLPC